MLGNINLFAKRGGFHRLVARIKDQTNKVNANALKFLLKPIIKVSSLRDSALSILCWRANFYTFQSYGISD